MTSFTCARILTGRIRRPYWERKLTKGCDMKATFHQHFDATSNQSFHQHFDATSNQSFHQHFDASCISTPRVFKKGPNMWLINTKHQLLLSLLVTLWKRQHFTATPSSSHCSAQGCFCRLLKDRFQGHHKNKSSDKCLFNTPAEASLLSTVSGLLESY